MPGIRSRTFIIAALVAVLLLQIGTAQAAPGWAVQSALNTPGGAILNGVSCPSATNCVTVGQDASGGPVVVERWNGASWSFEAAPSPTNGGNNSVLRDVSCPTSTRCIAVGETIASPKPLPLAEKWDGTTWTVTAIPKPDAGELAGVSCTTAHACTAVGAFRNGALPLVLRWNGTKWKQQSAPLPPGARDATFTDVSCASATACTAVGQSFDASGQSLVIEHWDGSAWTVQPAPTPSASSTLLISVSCPRATSSCVAVGQSYSGGTYHPVVERTDGAGWSIQATPEPDGATFALLSGVSCPSASACEAVGSSSAQPSPPDQFVPLTERWDGINWVLQPTPTPAGIDDSRPYNVDCSGPNACTLVGLSLDASNNRLPLVERYA